MSELSDSALEAIRLARARQDAPDQLVSTNISVTQKQMTQMAEIKRLTGRPFSWIIREALDQFIPKMLEAMSEPQRASSAKRDPVVISAADIAKARRRIRERAERWHPYDAVDDE